MPILITCPNCGHQLKAPDTAVGKKGKCPRCGTVMPIKAATESGSPGPAARPPERKPAATPPLRPAPPAPERPRSQPPARPKPPAPPPVLDPEPVEPESGDLLSQALDAEGQAEPQPNTYDLAAPAATPTPAAQDRRRPCPMCGEMIPIDALKCRFCGEIFDPALKKAEKKKAKSSGGSDDDEMSTGDWVVAILCPGIGCIAGIIWAIQGKGKGGKMIGMSVLFAVLWNGIGFCMGLLGEATNV